MEKKYYKQPLSLFHFRKKQKNKTKQTNKQTKNTFQQESVFMLQTLIACSRFSINNNFINEE